MILSEPAACYRFTAGQAFSALAAAQPSRPALRLPDRVVTYGELDAAADKVAQMLHGRGVVRRSVVGIVHAKTLEAYATMLACLKSGAIYVNLDETNPAERLERIFSTCRPSLVVGEALPEAASWPPPSRGRRPAPTRLPAPTQPISCTRRARRERRRAR
jgi:acyl-CoA synthetase (AMP-forming)/AMP-acid ligase II